MTYFPRPFHWRSRRDWADVLRAQAAIVRARASLALDPRGEVSAHAFEDESAAPDPADEATVRRLAIAVERAARRGPLRANCLVRALALRMLLRRAGVRGARVHVGVRPDGDGLAAHAWVSFGSLVIDDLLPRGAAFTELRLPTESRRA